MISMTQRLLSLSTAMLLATTAVAVAEPSEELIAAAKKEGTLTTIALPHNWCGYGDVIAGFKAKYGIEVNELNPDAGSGDEIEAIKANKGNTGPQAPDVIDVGLSFGPSAKAEGLIQPYKVSTWDTIPDTAKDPEGYWYGDYYGVLSFVVNTDIVKDVPKDWADLKKSDYANSVALAGDPRASNQAVQAVYAAGLAAGETDAAKAGEAGLAFFAEVNKAGNFVPVIGKSASLAQGSTPIIIAWDYNGLSWRDSLNGNPPVEVVVPASGVVAGVYVQAISAFAPHPNAAKLWMEYLYSDEGQLGWLKGYCHPIRFNDLVKNGKVPQEMLDKLPPAASYEKAVFPTLEEQEAGKAAITTKWDSVVGASVQ
ncbi:ABC transporter substrate-binding protein [Sinorhizobium medicae]|uniref:Extracellular solute-binding protein family 1 n=3 Tax=Sinorhizobium medicae TaxID=110321 RepID=A0A508WV22_9HYPH|nr:ABC transporter substrate-binding protein [Sinorhizobium medicae]MBO1943716.1 ABC transporter substrate-binding protein [Sinorhizobium medicae]MBO1964792.1 ABC transporter substrate-binding protein [Sinorhizobium medicae]MDX0960506.1 ABC transporter substrate-binding protein [Sinorhizobium medicae]TWA22682.1 putative spermidine/putrescine transport system substrate-binding protein [Sinorhizobium medicae]TWA29482.1 putative spermidine/putrescine transport system substrate-binding protein [Si